jgi:hypothetical protein
VGAGRRVCRARRTGARRQSGDEVGWTAGWRRGPKDDQAVRSWLDLAGCAGGYVDTKHCTGKSYPDRVSL